MRKSRVLSVAVLAALLWGLPAEAAQAGSGRAPATRGTGTGTSGYVPPLVQETGRVRVSLVGLLHTGKQDPGWRFSGQTLRDLLIVVEYRDLPAGPHTQRLKLFLPDGALYQQFTTEVVSDPPARRTGHSTPRWEPVEVRLPIGGTWITEHALYGTWRLEVSLDAGQPATTTTFILHK